MQKGFWGDLLRQYPVVGSIMLVGTVAGCIIGLVITSNLSQLRQPPIPTRVIALIVLGITIAGGFVGLVIGVIADSIFGVFRNEKKRPRRKRRKRNRDLGELPDLD